MSLAACQQGAREAPEGGFAPTKARHPTTSTTAPAPRLANRKWRRPGWIAKENAQPGTSNWKLPDDEGRRNAIRGFADATSVDAGDDVRLFVDSRLPWRAEAYRVGWYDGLGGRLVWRSDEQDASPQPPLVIDPATGRREAPWAESLAVSTAGDWPPGAYLLKLTNEGGASWVPLTVRDDGSAADLVVIMGVTTWQAYNRFGGASLYDGAGAARSQVVSFDRPYGGSGAGEFYDRERGFVLLAERFGYDVTYVTDIDIHRRPELMKAHRAVISLGHDEYYSPPMRDGLIAARDSGVNLAFLGGNAVWRKVRFEDSPIGPERRMVNYRSLADPIAATDLPAATVNWADAPSWRPSTEITGAYTECEGSGDWTVVDGDSWFFGGTGWGNGTVVKGLIGHEFDRVRPELGLAGPTQVIAHSPIACRDGGRWTFADTSYYTTPSGAGVLNAGTLWWIKNLTRTCVASSAPEDVCHLERLVRNVLDVFTVGPAGRDHPAVPNLDALGIVAAMPAGGVAASR